MTKVEELKELLTQDIIVDLEDYIDELFELVAKKNDTIDTKEELKTCKSCNLIFVRC